MRTRGRSRKREPPSLYRKQYRATGPHALSRGQSARRIAMREGAKHTTRSDLCPLRLHLPLHTIDSGAAHGGAREESIRVHTQPSAHSVTHGQAVPFLLPPVTDEPRRRRHKAVAPTRHVGQSRHARARVDTARGSQHPHPCCSHASTIPSQHTTPQQQIPSRHPRLNELGVGAWLKHEPERAAAAQPHIAQARVNRGGAGDDWSLLRVRGTRLGLLGGGALRLLLGAVPLSHRVLVGVLAVLARAAVLVEHECIAREL